MLAGPDAVRQTDSVEGVAGEREPGSAASALFDGGDAREMAERVLRHRVLHDVDERALGRALDAEERSQILERSAGDLGVVERRLLRVLRSADEGAEEDAALLDA